MSIFREYGESGVHVMGGVITQKNADYCTVRIRLPAGVVTVDQIRGLARIAKTYGDGTLHVTTRQTFEIPNVKPSTLEKLDLALKKNGTPIGAEFTEVVNVTACPGTLRCKYANIDSVELAKKIDEKYFRKELSIRVRIAISSCPNSCVASWESDIGIIGIQKPIRNPTLCSGCGTCVAYCKEHALTVRQGTVKLDHGLCNTCGNCIETCHYHVIKGEPLGYQIMVGGSHGRTPHVGRYLVSVSSEEELMVVIDGIIEWIRRYARSGSRFRSQIEEEGFDEFKAFVLKKADSSSFVAIENKRLISDTE